MKFFLSIIGIIIFLGAVLISSEAHFLVTNSNRINFYDEGEPQDMSSGLFSSYINDGNSDYRKIKAKGGLLIDFDLDGDGIVTDEELETAKAMKETETLLRKQLAESQISNFVNFTL